VEEEAHEEAEAQAAKDAVSFQVDGRAVCRTAQLIGGIIEGMSKTLLELNNIFELFLNS